jgi:FKBP-type peptidyl-prolyl cis-trans isomerase
MIQNFETMKIDSVLDMDLYLDAFFAASEEKELDMNPDSCKGMLDGFFKELQNNQRMMATDTTGAVLPFEPSQSTIDSVSYLLGADFGKGLTNSFKTDGLDSVLNVKLVVDGFVSALKKDELKLQTEENKPLLDVFFAKLRADKEKEEAAKLEAEFGDVKAAGEEYLAQNRGNSDVVETASGLQYEILVEGHGAKPTFANTVKVHYHGTLVDGTVFDSSVDKGEPATFPVGRVIPGWTEALQLMPVGSKWKLSIPYSIAYGTTPRPGGVIRPFDALIFEVELLEIVK